MVSELRARGVGETLDLAVALYRSRFLKVLVRSACVVVPVQVLSTIILLSAQPTSYTVNYLGQPQAQNDTKSALLLLTATIIVALISYTASAVVVGLCARPYADAYIDQPGTWKRGTVGGSNVAGVLVCALLVGFAYLAGFFFCGVGYFVALTFFAATLPALVLEGIGPLRAIGRSFTLTKSHFFRVLGVVATAWFLQFVLNLAVASGVNLWLHHGAGSDAAVITQGFASAVSATITTPLIAAAAVAIYFDCRIRDEAFDVQLLMQRNDARHAAPPSPPPAMQPAPAR